MLALNKQNMSCKNESSNTELYNSVKMTEGNIFLDACKYLDEDSVMKSLDKGLKKSKFIGKG